MLLIKKCWLYFVLIISVHAAYALENSVKHTTQSVLEFNPLIMANQGVGLNSEVLLACHTSVGGNLEYYLQNVYNRNSTQATRNMINIAPFIRYYIISPKLEKLFVGLKLNFFNSQAQIADDAENASYSNFFFAPTIHFGYRFVMQNGFTLSAYAGMGIKTSSNKFPAEKIPLSRASNVDWSNALDLLNTNVTIKQPDYGLTLGYVF